MWEYLTIIPGSIVLFDSNDGRRAGKVNWVYNGATPIVMLSDENQLTYFVPLEKCRLFRTLLHNKYFDNFGVEVESGKEYQLCS